MNLASPGLPSGEKIIYTLEQVHLHCSDISLGIDVRIPSLPVYIPSATRLVQVSKKAPIISQTSAIVRVS